MDVINAIEYDKKERKERRLRKRLFAYQGAFITSILLWHIYYFITIPLSTTYHFIGKNGIWAIMSTIFLGGVLLYEITASTIRKDTSLKVEKEITIVFLFFAIFFWTLVWFGAISPDN